jgi:hypothetical protein
MVVSFSINREMPLSGETVGSPNQPKPLRKPQTANR